MLINENHMIGIMSSKSETLGERLRRKRTALGKTQAELGKAAGISAAAIAQAETGDTKALRAENLFPIARALDADPEWLATGRGEEKSFEGIVRAIVELPDDDPQQALDFIQFRWKQSEGLVASEKIARYTVMIQRIKDDLSKRKKSGK